MQSHTLIFEILSGYEWLTVEFESESPGINLLMKVTMASTGWPLDTVDLRTADNDLWRIIDTKMQRTAFYFWDMNGLQSMSLIHRIHVKVAGQGNIRLQKVLKMIDSQVPPVEIVTHVQGWGQRLIQDLLGLQLAAEILKFK